MNVSVQTQGTTPRCSLTVNKIKQPSAPTKSFLNPILTKPLPKITHCTFCYIISLFYFESPKVTTLTSGRFAKKASWMILQKLLAFTPFRFAPILIHFPMTNQATVLHRLRPNPSVGSKTYRPMLLQVLAPSLPYSGCRPRPAAQGFVEGKKNASSD